MFAFLVTAISFFMRPRLCHSLVLYLSKAAYLAQFHKLLCTIWDEPILPWTY